MEQLGEKIRTISLISARFAWHIVLAVGAGAILLFLSGPYVGWRDNSNECFPPVAYFLFLVSLILLLRTFSQLSVSLFENGLVIKRLLRTDIIRWDDVSEVRISNLHTLRKKRLGSVVPMAFLLLDALISMGEGGSHAFESRYIFVMYDGRKKLLKGDARLFELAKPVSEGTFPYLARAAAQRLIRGDEVALTDHIDYSLKGLKGTISKGTHNRRRQVPFEKAWDHYSGYTLENDVFVLRFDGERLTGLAAADVKNPHVFTHMASMLKKGRSDELARLAGASPILTTENTGG